jgi:hypothetical protein
MWFSVGATRWDGWLAAYPPFNQGVRLCLTFLYTRFSRDGTLGKGGLG